jgi:hypothetical protein
LFGVAYAVENPWILETLNPLLSQLKEFTAKIARRMEEEEERQQLAMMMNYGMLICRFQGFWGSQHPTDCFP